MITSVSSRPGACVAAGCADTGACTGIAAGDAALELPWGDRASEPRTASAASPSRMTPATIIPPRRAGAAICAGTDGARTMTPALSELIADGLWDSAILGRPEPD